MKPSPVSLVVIVSVELGNVIVVLPSRAICTCCVSFIRFCITGVYRPTANGSSSNSTLVAVLTFRDVLSSDLVITVVVAPRLVIA